MACARDRGHALMALARRLDQDLAGLPRGIGHGDFWTGNLLIAGGRLRGVIDWAAARPDQLPLLDLINLRVGERESKYFGRALSEHLLPWARAGGDATSRAYCERLGLDLGPSQLEGLAIAWWLERVARELEEYGDRFRRPEWMRRNVELVLDALLAGAQR
jgi:thiamine kinase-like enzyme